MAKPGVSWGYRRDGKGGGGLLGRRPGLEGIGTRRVEVAGVHQPRGGGASVEVMPKGESGGRRQGMGRRGEALGLGMGAGKRLGFGDKGLAASSWVNVWGWGSGRSQAPSARSQAGGWSGDPHFVSKSHSVNPNNSADSASSRHPLPVLVGVRSSSRLLSIPTALPSPGGRAEAKW